MNALGRILLLWRRRWPLLAAGLVVAVASASSGALLIALAGAHVAVLLLGAVSAAGALLAVLGPARVVLRYAERLVDPLRHIPCPRGSARLVLRRALPRRSAGGLGSATLRRSGHVSPRQRTWRRWTASTFASCSLCRQRGLDARCPCWPILSWSALGACGLRWLWRRASSFLFARRRVRRFRFACRPAAPAPAGQRRRPRATRPCASSVVDMG